MALLTKQISSLVGGVSQQPDSTKFDSQCRLQENFFSSAATGLLKRAPTTYIENIGVIPDDAFVHFVDRDKQEKYILVIHDSTVKVFDLDGNVETVNILGGASYLNVSGVTDREAFRALTIADSTIIVNTTVTVDEDPGSTPSRNPEALVYVKEGKFGKTYKVKVFDDSGNPLATASYQVPDGATASDTEKADTTFIATQLSTSLSAALDPSYTVTQEGNLIHIENTADFEIATEDGFGDTAMYALKDTVSLFSDLPRKAPEGFVIAVNGDSDGVVTSKYFVEAQRNSGTTLKGISFPDVTWEESVASDIPVGIDNTTMPHVLVRGAGGAFTYNSGSYGQRTVGDEESAANPSFVEDKINGVFFHANRLGFLSGESVSMSESGNIFNFYPTAVSTLLAADPVIFTVNSPKVSVLRHAIPWNEQVVLFSDKHQFVLQSEGNVTNSSISVQPATDFEINSNVSPLAVGNNIYFANNIGEFTEVREYYVADFVANKDAANVTAHIPTYIDKNVDWMVSSDNGKTVVMTSTEDKTILYVYQVLWNGQEKIQSAWHQFKFNDYEIIGGDFVGSVLYAMIRKPGETDVYLEKIDFSESLVEFGAEYLIYLDNRLRSDDVRITINYNAGNDETTYTLPYDIDATNFKVIEADGASDRYGENVEYTINGLNDVVVDGDTTSTLMWFGNTYSSKYQFGSIFLKEQSQGGGQRGVTIGRTQVLKALINYDKTAQFDVYVTLQGRQPKKTSFFGRIKGNIMNIFGKIGIATDVFKVPVNGKNDKTEIVIQNDSHLPSNLQFVDFEIRYNSNNGRRAG